MRRFLSLLLFSFSWQLQAISLDDYFNSNIIEEVCRKTLKLPVEKSSENFGPRFKFQEGELFYVTKEESNRYIVTKLKNLSQQDLLYISNDKIIDIEINENNLWIAHKSYINKYNLLTDSLTKIRPLLLGQQLTSDQKIHDIHYMDQILYIAHGSYGIFAYHASTNQLIWRNYVNVNQSSDHRSKIINIVGEYGILYAGLDNVSTSIKNPNALNGFITFRADTPFAYTKSSYDNINPKIIANSHTTIEDSVLYINNLGHLQYLETNVIKPNQLLKLKWHPNWYQDIDIRRTATWKGNALIENNTAYGCAQFIYTQNQHVLRKIVKPFIRNL